MTAKKQGWEWSLSGFAGTESRGVRFLVWGRKGMKKKHQNQKKGEWEKKKKMNI